MKYHAFISFLEICWVGATLCIFSRQVGLSRRKSRNKKKIVVNYQVSTGKSQKDINYKDN
jgi:hypothetical protein